MAPSRRLVGRVLAIAIAMQLTAISWCAADDPGVDSLPQGAATPAIELPFFPSRLHAFIWRNWGLVERARIALVLKTSEENVAAIAQSMGLPGEPIVAHEFSKRGYATLIRRNWHLLPYEQLLVLLDMSAERLGYLLREDDFLWIKLGSVKPRCETLVYALPDATARARAAEIKAFVDHQFGARWKDWATDPEPRFAFLDHFRQPDSRPALPATKPAAWPPQALRFLYSYFAVYGDPLTDPSLDPYPDTLLRELSDLGVTGVWLHVVLRDLAPGGPSFPEFGNGYEKRLENLRALTRRARRYGIGVYLYINEPRAMPSAFFKNRPEMAGVHEGDSMALCTSDPTVRKWMEDSLAYVFGTVPDLAGVFTISASENLTNCASHGHAEQCPRCKLRSGADLIAEVNSTIEAGVHRGNPAARVIVWDWGWPDEWAPKIIAALPKSAWFMSVSEWSLPIMRGGVQTAVGEYSLSAVGPGPRATRHWELARAAGLKTVAKVQLNNSWELSAIPYLPVMDLVAAHCEHLASAGVDGMMLGWTLGGYPSPNLQLASGIIDTGNLENPHRSASEMEDAIAVERYGAQAAPLARSAWKKFSDAFVQYPFDAGVIYQCPVQMGPANLLYARPTGYAATMVGFPYDDAPAWSGPYGPKKLAAQFEQVALGWRQGLDSLAQAIEQTPPDKLEAARADLRFARAAGLHFHSVSNQVRFVLARDALRGQLSPERQKQEQSELRHLAEDEMATAEELFGLARVDSRIGFEASNHYYYVPLDLVEKAIDCQYVLDHVINN